MNLCDIREVKALLGRHGFRFSKSMGQNFLVADWVPREIAAAGGGDGGCGVLEIGPGIGCLTQELCRCAGKVVSVELDHALLPVLEETMDGAENFTLISGDILKLDIPALADQHFQGLTPMVCANLPYNITSPALQKFVETPCFQSVTVLIQKEVARRLSAPQGSPEGGAFSLFLQYHMETEALFEVPRDKFLPAPKVDSAVLRCVRRDRPAVEVPDEAFFFKLLRGAFLLRRKTLVNSLSAALPGRDKASIQAAIEACGLQPGVRGERLTLRDFAALAEALREKPGI